MPELALALASYTTSWDATQLAASARFASPEAP